MPAHRGRQVWLCDSLDFFSERVTRCYRGDPWAHLGRPSLLGSCPQLKRPLRSQALHPSYRLSPLTPRKPVLVTATAQGALTCSQVKRTDDGTTTRSGHSFR